MNPFLRNLLFIALMGVVQLGVSQNQNNNWCFGNRALVSFNNNAATSSTGCEISSTEGCASVSDPISGNLLFYTNGSTIWGADNQPFPNGTGLLGGTNTSSTQGTTIVPYPGQANKYVVFTSDESYGGAINGFRYTVVNMNLNGNLGDVELNQKNILINPNSTERVAVAVNGNNTGYWILIHERNNNVFKAYSFTASGISNTPVTSSVGSIHTSVIQGDGDATMGQLKFNQNYTQLAVALFSLNKIEVFNFNNCSGEVSGGRSLSTVDTPYGIEFSPSNQFLYYSILYSNTTFTGQIFQSNLLSNNLTGIRVGNFEASVGSLQLAPNGKIYAAITSEEFLACINSPNSAGLACGFVYQAVPLALYNLSPTQGIYGLPPFVPNLIAPINPVADSVDVCSSQLPYSWNGIPLYNPGTYNTTITNQAGCDSAISVVFSINNPSFSETNLTICEDQLPLNWNGITCTSSGQYTSTLTGSNTCDSLARLNLTITNTTYSSINQTVCELDLPVVLNGNNYNNAGIFLQTLTNQAGCDSILTFTLEVSSPVNFSTNVSLCNSQFPYTWNNQVYSLPGTYTDTLTTSLGCDSIITLVLLLQENQQLDALMAMDSCQEKSVNVKTSAAVLNLNTTWYWGDGQQSNSASTTSSHQYTSSGSYPIMAIINNTCQPDTLTLSIDLIECTEYYGECTVYLPNSFTPNGDGINDEFFASLSCIPEFFNFSVFDRWGVCLFTSNEPTSKWNGRYRNQNCPLDVYVYQVTTKAVNGQANVINGTVALIK